MPGPSHVLAIDLGASGGRVIRGSWNPAEQKVTLHEVHRFANEAVELHGTLYWDILRLFHEIKTGIRAAVRGLPTGESIACLGIDTWGVDFGLLDQHGRLLGNPVHYRDRRTSGMVDHLTALLGEGTLFHKTGIQDAWFNTVGQLMGGLAQNPDYLKNAATLLFIPDLLNYFLTGIKNGEHTIASTSQLLSAGSSLWDEYLLESLALPSGILPPVVEAGEFLGPITSALARETGLEPSVRVATVPSHDTASAVLAVPVVDGRTSAYISCGTWSIIGSELDSPILTEAARLAGFSNEAGTGGKTLFQKKQI